MELFKNGPEDDFQIGFRRGAEMVVATMRFPEDDDWKKRSAKRKVTIRKLGRASETSVDSTAADAALYERVRCEGSPDLEPEEAVFVISKIAQCDVVGVEPADDCAVVSLSILGCDEARVKLKYPSQRQVMNFGKASTRLLDFPYGRQEVKVSLDPAARLFDELFVDAQGYTNERQIPIIHQDTAVRALIDFVETDQGDADIEDF